MWRLFRNGLPFGVLCHAPEDAGGGAGGGAGAGAAGSGAAGAGAGAGTGAGAAGSGAAGGGTGGAGAPAHYALTPDSMIIPPGGTEPVKYSDWSKGYIPRDQVGMVLREILAANKQQPKPQPQQQQPPPDPFGDIEAMPLVDGKTVAALARQLIQNGFSPRDKIIKALQEQVKQLSGHMTSSRTGSLQNDYSVSRDQVIAALPIPKLDKPIDGANEALTEFVDGVFWKYDFEKRFSDPNARQHVMKEFTDTVKKEFDGARKFFRALEKADLEAAEDKARRARFVRPTAQSGPNGPMRPIRETNAQKAARMFRGGRESAT